MNLYNFARKAFATKFGVVGVANAVKTWTETAVVSFKAGFKSGFEAAERAHRKPSA